MDLKHNFKYFKEHFKKVDYSSFILGADIGGTYANIGIAGVKNRKFELLFKLNFESKKIDSVFTAIKTTMNYAKNKHDIDIKNACIGAAGAVSDKNDYVKLTNIPWDINTKEILEKTSLESAFIVNDFQAVGYGVNLLDHNNKNDIHIVRKASSTDKQTKAIIGAGTGLGKSILVYDQKNNIYKPIPSEGGHADFSIYNDFEQKIVNFVKKLRNIEQPLTYEELLSGRGLESIYSYFRVSDKFKESNYTKEIDASKHKAALISKYRNQDETCSETFKIFTKFYGRCAKNFALDCLAKGGLYIAGGIASKNVDIFSTEEFLNEFENAYRKKEILKQIPIYIIKNYDVSLYGACLAALYLKNVG